MTWELLLEAARRRFAKWFRPRQDLSDEDDDCGCCNDAAGDFDADELGLDPEERYRA